MVGPPCVNAGWRIRGARVVRTEFGCTETRWRFDTPAQDRAQGTAWIEPAQVDLVPAQVLVLARVLVWNLLNLLLRQVVVVALLQSSSTSQDR